ncbi:glutathione S-transferase family protein [Rhodanobacter sp. BL-MT-08]
MSEPLTIVGSYISPYVRKVLVFLELKGIDYRIDPIPPFVGNDEFSQLSPLRRIPVMRDGDLLLNDSSVICQYLEDRRPQVSLYPVDIADRARARWLEEYADVALGDAIAGKLFYQLGIKPNLFGETTNEDVVRQARKVDLPAALDYLETQLPADGFIFGEPSIADISIASFFRMAGFVRYTIDATRWPRCAGLVAHTLALPVFAKLATFEDRALRTPVPEQRAVLKAMNAPLTDTTCGDAPPRRGVIAID